VAFLTTLQETSSTSSKAGYFKPRHGKEREKDNAVFELFEGMHASDEIFFPTLLAWLGYLRPDLSDDEVRDVEFEAESAKRIESKLFGNSIASPTSPSPSTSREGSQQTSIAGDEVPLETVWRRRVTYCDWSNSVKNPRTFASWREVIDSGHFEKARGEGCLFLRKLKTADRSGQEVRDWVQCVYRCGDEGDVSTMSAEQLEDIIAMDTKDEEERVDRSGVKRRRSDSPENDASRSRNNSLIR
jgi:hypothetical protein